MNILIQIGDSDDKLTQAEWAEFIGTVRRLVVQAGPAVIIHGEWFSAPDSRWQNANWCIQVDNPNIRNALRLGLIQIREKFRQDSIAWTQGEVTFI